MDLNELAMADAFMEAVNAVNASPGSASSTKALHSGFKLPLGTSSFVSASCSALLLLCSHT